MNRPIDPAALSRWLQDNEVPASRADSAAAELADSWNDGDVTYQSARDILGDHLADDDPRPKYLADDVAATAGITLTD